MENTEGKAAKMKVNCEVFQSSSAQEEASAVLLQELIVLMVQRKLMRPAYLDILLDTRLTQLIFRSDQRIIKSTQANLIAARCPNLTKLCIPFADSISASVLVTLVKSLPKLRHLDVAGTKCNDQVLAVLGYNCPHLEVLDINACNYVTDSGIFSLCLSFDESRPKCNKLREIIMFCPLVSTKGVKAILENCPVVEYVGQMALPDAMIELHHESVIDGLCHEGRLYHLREVSWTLDSHHLQAAEVTSNWKLVTNHCPSLRSVRLDLECDITSEWLEPLCKLDDLQEIQLSNGDFAIFGLVQLFESRGHNLTSLELCCQHLVYVSMTTIGALCPNLQKLMVSVSGPDMDTYMSDTPKQHYGVEVFTNIEMLTLRYWDSSNSHPAFLMDILPHCKQVKKLILGKLDFLTDEMITEILVMNPLEHLESLHLVRCDSVTASGVDRLLLSCPLQKVRLLHCSDISRRDFEVIKRQAQINKWDLDIDWL